MDFTLPEDLRILRDTVALCARGADSAEVSGAQVLGEFGNGFVPIQDRFGMRRIKIACRLADRARSAA